MLPDDAQGVEQGCEHRRLGQCGGRRTRQRRQAEISRRGHEVEEKGKVGLGGRENSYGEGT